MIGLIIPLRRTSPLLTLTTPPKKKLQVWPGCHDEVLRRESGKMNSTLNMLVPTNVVVLLKPSDIVLADCCADGDEEVYRVLTTKIFPRHADVLAVDDWNKYKLENQ